MKRKPILAAVLAVAVFSMSGCGASDKLASITLTQKGSSSSGGFFNLKGIGGTLQLAVLANYTSGKQIEETNFSTYTVTAEGVLDDNATPLPTPPLSITISSTAMLTAVDPAICTWVDLSSDPTKPSWFLSGNYKIVATYKGLQSQPLFVGVASAGGQDPNGACGP